VPHLPQATLMSISRSVDHQSGSSRKSYDTST
jgi:hypothetical protein